MNAIPTEQILPLLAPLLLLLPFAILGFKSFNELIHVLETSHADAWEASGRPSPVGFILNSGKQIRPENVIASFFSVLQWIVKTPVWTQTDDRAQTLLRRLRICAVIWNVGFVLFAINLARGLLPYFFNGHPF
jgi:hypothetical protein